MLAISINTFYNNYISSLLHLLAETMKLPKTSEFGDPESEAAQKEGSYTRDNASDKGVFIVVQTSTSARFVDPFFWEYNMYIFLRWKT